MASAATILLTGMAVGCNSGDGNSGKHEPPPASHAASSDEDLTRTVFQATWSNESEDQKDVLCTALDVYGSGWVENEMSSGDDGSSGINWHEAMGYLKSDCAER